MLGIIGRKVGMTSVFTEDGVNVPVTVLEAGPCVVAGIRTEDKDGYSAVQLGFEEKKEKHTNNAELGQFKKAGIKPMRKLIEFRDYEGEVNLGDEVNLSFLEEGEFVDVVGTSKGKGFQGVVKRHGFGGVGQRTHGQHNRERAPGSIGASSYPSRVFKGMRMAGRTGGDRVKALNLQVVKVLEDKNLLLVKGSVPGANGSYVIIERWS